MRIFKNQQNTEGLIPFESPVSAVCDNEVTPSPHVYNSRTGFTLVETLVAVTILLLVIIGPMTIAQKGIQNAYYAREQLVAVSLALEAVEGVRELRDARALEVYEGESGSTNSWIPTSCVEGNCAYVSGDNNDVGSITSCSGAEGYCNLKYNTVTKEYAHSFAGNQSNIVSSVYSRRITISTPVGGGVAASSDVEWAGKIFGGTTRQVVLQTWIYDHYRRYE